MASGQRQQGKQLYRNWLLEGEALRELSRRNEAQGLQNRRDNIAALRRDNPFNSLFSRDNQNQPWMNSSKGPNMTISAAEKQKLIEDATLDYDGLLLVNTQLSPRLKKWNITAAVALNDYITVYDTATNNPDLSPTGRDKAIAEAAAKWSAFLAEVEADVTNFGTDITASLAQLKREALDKGNASFVFLESGTKEIRDLLASKKPSERISFLNDNATPEMLAALNTYPLDSLRKSIVDDEMLEYFTDKMLRAVEPVKMADLDIAKEAHKEARLNLYQMQKARTARELCSRRKEYVPDSKLSLDEQVRIANANK